MGQEVKVIYTDDLEKSRGNRVELDPEALRQETVSWGGRSVKVYLSEASWKELDELLAPLLEAASPTKRPDRAASKAAQLGRGNRDVFRRVREWADARNRSYRTPGGGYYYDASLRKDYTADTGEEVPDLRAGMKRPPAFGLLAGGLRSLLPGGHQGHHSKDPRRYQRRGSCLSPPS